jgi:hypothetical protein
MSEDRLSDDALVVRGGLLTPEKVQQAAGEEPDGTWGLSVQSAPGMSIRDLVREGSIPHSKVSVSSVGRIRSLGTGFDVKKTDGVGNHGTLVIPSRPVTQEDASAVASAFDDPIINPTRPPKDRSHEGSKLFAPAAGFLLERGGSMERLLLDFNRRDAQNRVRIGPAVLQRTPALLQGRLRPSDAVEVIDADGNRCLGVLRADATMPRGHQFVVEMQWDTWVDAGDEATSTPGTPGTPEPASV